MKLGTIIKFENGWIGTICYHNLDGNGGVWGEHDFTDIMDDIKSNGGFTDKLPAPDFMMRDFHMEGILKSGNSLHNPEMKCIGEYIDYEIIEEGIDW